MLAETGRTHFKPNGRRTERREPVYLLGQREGLMIDDRRIRVGHREDHRDAAGERSGGARREVLFVNRARIARVHVDIDEAREFDHRPRRHAVCVRCHTRRASVQHSHSLRNTRYLVQ